MVNRLQKNLGYYRCESSGATSGLYGPKAFKLALSSARYLVKPLLTIVAAFIFLFPAEVFSAPALDAVQNMKQPNGYPFKARQKGDEWNNWVESEDGYGIFKSKSTGFWQYYVKETAPPRAGGLGKSALRVGVAPADTVNTRVGEVSPKDMSIPKGLRPKMKARPKHAPALGMRSAVMKAATVTAPSTVPLLVIAVDYADQNATYTATQVKDRIFGGAGTLQDYYNDVSYGATTITPAAETNGTANDGIIGWLRDPNGVTTHPSTGVTNSGTDDAELARNAMIAADSFINYSTYDTDSSGTVEPDELAIIIIVAGYETATVGSSGATPSVWALKYNVNSSTTGALSLDGVSLGEFAIFGEIHANSSGANARLATMGIIAHESGHLILGLPDLYDTSNVSYGIGYFGLMGNGNWGSATDAATDITSTTSGTAPTHLSAWSKEYIGWGTVSDITTSVTGTTVSQSFPSADGTKASIFRINTSDSNQYFLIENRQLSGSYDVGFTRRTGAGSHGGLVIWHIDSSVASASKITQNRVNYDVSNKGVDVEEAVDGGLDAGTSPAKQTMFWYSGNTSAFSGVSTPNSKLKSGSNSGITIDNFSASGATMTADVTKSADTTAPATAYATPVDTSTEVQVTLTCSDNSGGTGCDKTYYTTDGTTPTTSSSVYTTTLTFTSTTTLKYFSTDLAGNAESVTSRSISIATSSSSSSSSSGGGGAIGFEILLIALALVLRRKWKLNIA